MIRVAAVAPGRRARRSLLLSGLVVAVGIASVAVCVGLLGGGPPLWVSALIAAVPLVVAVAAGFSARLRRASTVVLVAASDFAGLAVAVDAGLILTLLVLGRFPSPVQHGLVNAAMLGMLLVATLAGPLGRRAGRSARLSLLGTRRSPDELLAEFAERAGRGTPVDDLLRRLAETMRRDWRLSSVQIWTLVPGDPGLHRTLVVPEPFEEAPPPAPLDATELATLERAGVAGPGWVRLWLPRLGADATDGGVTGQLRLAPAVHGGRVLALVVVERPADADRFTTADERALAEVARRLAIVLRNRDLDETLQATLADLRRSNADLQASRGRLVRTADAERRRIERDLHDGAQQHLVALAVGLRLVRDGLSDSGETAASYLELIDELDAGVRESIQELRHLAHGIYPPLLRDSGLGEALRAAAKRNPLDVTVEVTGLGRHSEQREAAVYFCCLEALQNAAKHAPQARVVVSLEEDDEQLSFSVSDDGPGCDVDNMATGAGMQNMADRLGAIGGTLELSSALGRGTTVGGRVPLNATPSPMTTVTAPVTVPARRPSVATAPPSGA